MIYFDNSATTYPKPESVRRTVAESMVRYGANPGRAGHRAAMQTAEAVYRARMELAKFFHTTNCENVIFTSGCTQAINMVLKGKLCAGDHVVLSCVEHNAVYRPIFALADTGVTHTIAKIFPGDTERTLQAFEACIKPNTRLIVCTQASNVWGIRLPVEQLAALAHAHNAELLVDAAQSAGVVDIDLNKTPIDYLCCAGHKGLYGPMGTGVLVARGTELKPLIEGGTGSRSASPQQPEDYPDRLESGTPNTPGILGLAEGVRFVRKKGISRIMTHEIAMIRRLYTQLQKNPNVILYTAEPTAENSVPVLSFNVYGKTSEETAAALDRAGIAVRAGLHCAPLAHNRFGTLPNGAVRVSVSVFNRPQEIDRFIMVIKDISK